MPTSATYGLRSPSSGDDVDVNGDIQILADDVDAALASIANSSRTNHWINGSWFINQRQSASYTCTGGQSKVTVDMLRLVSGTGATNSVTPTVITPGAMDDHPKMKLAWDRTVLGASDSYIETFVEGVHTFAGSTITVGALSDVSSGTKRYKVQVVQHFGSGGGASSQVVTTGATVTVDSTTSWRTTTIAVPSIAGKTVGTDGKDHVLIRLVRESGWETGVLNLYEASILRGATTARPERRSEAADLPVCQRNYFQLGPFGASRSFGWSRGVGTTSAVAYVALPVPMRTTPTVTVSAGTHFTCNGVNTTAVAGGSGTTNVLVELALTFAGGFAANAAASFDNTASTANAAIYANAEPW